MLDLVITVDSALADLGVDGRPGLGVAAVFARLALAAGAGGQSLVS